MSSQFDSPQIAIVIPLFKHSVLVADALASAIAQKSQYPLTIIVVNDGCPFRESHLLMKSILTVYPDFVRYVFQSNAGLSAARNTGIDYAISNFPSLNAIYFMDADNAILPETIASAYSKLLREPETSWIYPNIDMFGLKRNFDYSGPYSALRHTQYNICEAGSLVHRRVFDAGIRFDERMRLGYEDWDFWLTAAGHGFKGAQHPYFGFRYRNRGESMLTESHRVNDEIEAYIARKHAAFLSKRNLLRLESEEAPRYAILFGDTNEVLLTSGAEGSLILQAEFDEQLWRNMTAPTRQYIPPFFVFTTRRAFDELRQSGLILWALHDSEVVLKDMNIACLLINRLTRWSFEVNCNGRPQDCDVLTLGRDLICAAIRAADTRWIEQVVSPEAPMKVVAKTVSVPGLSSIRATPKGTAIASLLQRTLSWRSSPYRAAADRRWIWRDFSIPPPHSVYFNVRAAFGGEVVYPWPSTDKNIGFVLPIASFGGVERVAYNLAQAFSDANWHVHLFVIGTERIDIPQEFSSSFASINFLNDAGFGGWDQESIYQGTALPAARNNQRVMHRIEAALAWLDVVVNCHCSEVHIAAANLRRLGVKTVAHVHLLDQSPYGRSVGHPIMALAYEYAYDLLLSPSRQLTSWMHGAGVPYEKLLHLRNAPGHRLDPKVQKQILAGRKSSINQRLNVLYLGRLDRQKGIDRVADVVKRTREMSLPIKWRIVGSGVTNDYPTPPVVLDLLEPAVFDSEALTSLFAWADVMVLLSDYEGVPLSVLEAQRLGVVVIATDVGAMREIVFSGKTGLLVQPETAVDEVVSLLTFLLEAPAFRLSMAEAAAQVIEWPEAAAEFIERITVMTKGGRDTLHGEPTDVQTENLLE